jgi:hypothetical protein
MIFESARTGSRKSIYWGDAAREKLLGEIEFTPPVRHSLPLILASSGKRRLLAGFSGLAWKRRARQELRGGNP